MAIPISAAPLQFLWVSDIHFDPLSEPKLVDQLAKANTRDWPSILSSHSNSTFRDLRYSRFSEDTNWPLFSSALEAMRLHAHSAKFVVVTGDLLVHRFHEKFSTVATQHDDAAFESFATKTLQFVGEQLQTVAPQKPVLIALGNNDASCGDYAGEPHGMFLRETSPMVKSLLGALADGATDSDWRAWGTYSVGLPTKGLRVISLNSTFFSPRYENSCSSAKVTHEAQNPGLEELAWLRTKLADARSHREKVWLILHIPPGVDGYSTSKQIKNGVLQKVVLMWKREFTAEFQKLLEEYSRTVVIGLAGHEHVDDFRLLNHSLVLLTPGLSPVANQNPAFRIVEYRSSGTLTDAQTFYLSNLDATATGVAPEWVAEYSFNENWRLKQLDYNHFQELYHEVQVDPDARERWSKLYRVSRSEGGSLTQQTFGFLFCATGNASEESYRSCLERVP